MDIKWVTFTKRTNDPKLKYLESLLDTFGIKHRRHGESWHAPILEVPEDRLDDAWALLCIVINNQMLDDMPDDHRMFCQ